MRPEILNPLFGLIENLQGIGSRYNKLVCNLVNGKKIVDLLWHLPINLIDRTYGTPLNRAVVGRIWTGKIKTMEHLAPPTKKQPYRIAAVDEPSGWRL